MPPGWDCHVHVFTAATADAPLPGSHYRPEPRPLAEIEALAEAHGVGHLVLVQPSVYGTDNRVLLDALRSRPGRHRGVVVVAADVDAAELDAMHALGVRGVRFNRVSPVGTWDAAALERLAPALRRLDWHVQWYVRAARLPEIAALQRASGLRFVLDHLGGLHEGLDDDVRPQAWDALAALAQDGAWIKLSGWYRLHAEGQAAPAAPYAALDATLRRVAALFGEARCVWGSDWPHTGFAPGAAPDYASTWAPVPRVLGVAAAARIRTEAPEQLYR